MNLKYDSLPYANLSVKINQSIEDGPGQDLISDPLNTSLPLYLGNTISNQTFETQFILDMQHAIGISVDRVFITNIRPGDVAYFWRTTSVIVDFIFLERQDSVSITLLEAIATLTIAIQNSSSNVYIGTNVTRGIDFLYGVNVLNWDVSLKLSYAIEVIGGNETIDDYYLNQGGQELCQTPLLYDYPTYCEFERFFEDDVSQALNISVFRVQILFVKKAALDASLIYFRILPPRNSDEQNITSVIGNLIEQVLNPYSALYLGNVTLRVDPTWGVSGAYRSPRTKAALFTHKYYEIDQSRLNSSTRMLLNTPYDRCKANHRCNWGEVDFNQSTNEATYFQRLFEQGQLFNASLFIDFEDWRIGTRGFNWVGNPPLTSMLQFNSSSSGLPGALFWPFNETSLGPTVPGYLHDSNQGLVLDRQHQVSQISIQSALVDDLYGRMNWLRANIDTINMGARLRSRRDVRLFQVQVLANVTEWYKNELAELILLNSSQCVYRSCNLLFNTSSATLTGAINATGVVQSTPNGTEVAIFAFDSIRLGPEVGVTVIGQRALVLTSRTSVMINTTISAQPGTLGGFPGGGSVARLASQSLSDMQSPVMICDLTDTCDNSRPNTNFSHAQRASLISNNINGPGSGNLRIYPFVLKTSAAEIPEVQYIRTQAFSGQTLTGGYVLKWGDFQTTPIPHDVDSISLQNIIEVNFNNYSPYDVGAPSNRLTGGPAGVGRVEVSRSPQDSEGGYEWRITFTSAIGNVDQIQAINYLQSLGANISTGTIQEGNEIGGFLKLSFNGFHTVPISSFETAAGLRNALEALPSVAFAYVERTDPTNNCNDGLCENGPLPSHGLIWTAYVTTNEEYGNVSPYSPTSPVAHLNGTIAQIMVDYAALTGVDSIATVSLGLGSSPDQFKALLSISTPFSLAFGGCGGSYGGLGGRGYFGNPTGPVYGVEGVTDIFGGSGGCMRAGPFEANAFQGIVDGQGGAGGGAIEVIAINDILIGKFGRIIMMGGDGGQTSEGGGEMEATQNDLH